MQQPYYYAAIGYRGFEKYRRVIRGRKPDFLSVSRKRELDTSLPQNVKLLKRYLGTQQFEEGGNLFWMSRRFHLGPACRVGREDSALDNTGGGKQLQSMTDGSDGFLCFGKMRDHFTDSVCHP